jgi:hypothetical protein|tara:strand:+ start:2770 stop:3045 length:276 start_codon:yes stop_codon:yes gene_type:complete
MIYQLPNGRIIEMSLEQFLELDDIEIRDLNGLGKEYTSDITNPFYKSTLSSNKREKPDEPEVWEIEEREPNLDEIKDIEKMDDQYFHRDDT